MLDILLEMLSIGLCVAYNVYNFSFHRLFPLCLVCVYTTLQCASIYEASTAWCKQLGIRFYLAPVAESLLVFLLTSLVLLTAVGM